LRMLASVQNDGFPKALKNPPRLKKP